jgi:D-tyrosyl-tRNA(Tyr) deacylase
MRVVLQRVNEAQVSVGSEIKGHIKLGLLIFLGIAPEDSAEDIDWLCNKICNLRIFNDPQGQMNLSLKDIDGEALLVSQFTLHAQTNKGNRPSYIKAAKPDLALPLYKLFIKQFENNFGKKINTGVFGAEMMVSLVNDGPVTLIIDSKNRL